ncbi:unnamed protein product [Chrysodeixis includens]|uniref:Methyltransferase domain-containing protein n=1 Tax=Chrysodeixis includens TaxID=689277 RepID=A0A9N8PZM5_CHRIL|nr:unnamed protein product [Chrysodeixis includens]
MVGINFKKKPVNIIFLESYSSQEDYKNTHEMKVPLETLTLYCIYKFCAPHLLQLKFVPLERPVEMRTPALSIYDENLVFIYKEDVPWQVAACKYPAAMCADVIVTGLCAVARHICLFKHSEAALHEHDHGILGFRHNCLQASHEVSIWTQFCEIDLINAVNEILSAVHVKEIPINLVRYENHLKKPVHIHTMYKVARDMKREEMLRAAVTNDEDDEETSQDADYSNDSSPEEQPISIPKSEFRNSLQHTTIADIHLSSPIEDIEMLITTVQIHTSGSSNGNPNNITKAEIHEAKPSKSDLNGHGSMIVDQVSESSGVANEPSNGHANKVSDTEGASAIQVYEEAGTSGQGNACAVGDGACATSAVNVGASTSNEYFGEAIASGSGYTPNTSFLDDDEELSEPIDTPSTSRMFNQRQKSKNKKHRKIELKNLQIIHQFAEGPFFTIADVVLLPSYYLIHQAFGDFMFETYLPHTAKWFRTVKTVPEVDVVLDLMNKQVVKSVTFDDVIVPADEVSLYRGDPKRSNPRKRVYTTDEDIEKALNSITDDMVYPMTENELKPTFNWESIPNQANPTAGHMPSERVTRKTEQLENLANTVIKIAKTRDTIVDFYCGSGHLAILLAYLLPQCTVILLENKEQCLDRARAKVFQLNLKNVLFYQCNLDFFHGKFQIGIGLHACGVAGDIVLDKCLKAKAKFVISPCCYCSLRPSNRIPYPRSQKFSNVPIEQYLRIAHAADQTHKDEPCSERAARCMAVIDSDRLRFAEEAGYKVTLTYLKPLSCTAKNNLMLGVPI